LHSCRGRRYCDTARYNRTCKPEAFIAQAFRANNCPEK
jgi:hypothetical protein